MIENSKIVTKRLTRLDAVSRIHLGGTHGLATGGTGSRTAGGSSDNLKEGAGGKPEDWYEVSRPARNWESSEIALRGGYFPTL